MSEASTNPLRRPHWVVAAAVLAAFGTYLFGLSRAFIEDVVNGPPLAVRVIDERDYLSDLTLVTSALVTDPTKTVADLPAAAVDDWGWYHAARAWSDVATARRSIRLEFRTDERGPVVIERVVPRIVRKAPPESGWFVATGGCGLVPVRRGSLDLDAPVPKVDIRAADGGDLAKLYVASGDVEILQIDAYTRRHYVEWTLDVAFSAPDGRGTVTVDAGGEPFKISTEVGSRGYRPDWSSRRLQRYPAWDDGIDMC
jgi:hypothetical protein